MSFRLFGNYEIFFTIVYFEYHMIMSLILMSPTYVTKNSYEISYFKVKPFRYCHYYHPKFYLDNVPKSLFDLFSVSIDLIEIQTKLWNVFWFCFLTLSQIFNVMPFFSLSVLFYQSFSTYRQRNLVWWLLIIFFVS